MDEILSSIRQIIADDDAAGAARSKAPRPAAEAGLEPEPEPEPDPVAIPKAAEEPEPVEAPLALSQSQIVENAPDAGEEVAMDDAVSKAGVANAPAKTRLVVPDDVTVDADADTDADTDARPADRGTPSPLPDPDLSTDLAEQLLAPTADAATRHAFTQLNALALAGKQRTIEDLIREMLRPMLKGWLDENLPGMVERMVQSEIERISGSRR